MVVDDSIKYIDIILLLFALNCCCIGANLSHVGLTKTFCYTLFRFHPIPSDPVAHRSWSTGSRLLFYRFISLRSLRNNTTSKFRHWKQEVSCSPGQTFRSASAVSWCQSTGSGLSLLWQCCSAHIPENCPAAAVQWRQEESNVRKLPHTGQRRLQKNGTFFKPGCIRGNFKSIQNTSLMSSLCP